MEPIVFVIDDDEEVRTSVCTLIESRNVKCQAFASGEEFLAAYDPIRPGCLITDLRMGGMSGMELQKEVLRRGWNLPTIFVSGYLDVHHTVSAMKHGAEYVLEKPYRDEELWEVVQTALRRGELGRSKQERYEKLRSQFAQLSREERQVLDLIVTGSPNKSVARQLDIGLRTVEDRRRRIMEKVGADSFAQLMTWFTEWQTMDQQLNDPPP